MSRWSSALFLLVAVAVGFGGAKGYMYWKTRGQYGVRAPVRTGIGNAPAWRGVTLPSTATDATLKNIPAIHQTAIALTDPGSSGALASLTKSAHDAGLKVLLLPPPSPTDAKFAPTDPLNPYMRPLQTVAKEAAAAEVDALCISWWQADPDEETWKKTIVDIRKVFPGKVMVAGTPDVLLGVEFLRNADLLGVIGPLDLPKRLPHASKDKDLHDLRVAWACDLDSLESIAQQHGTPLFLINMLLPPTTDPADAALTYEALATETKGRSGIGGLFLPWLDTPATKSAPLRWQTFKTADGTPLTALIATTWATASDSEPSTH